MARDEEGHFFLILFLFFCLLRFVLCSFVRCNNVLLYRAVVCADDVVFEMWWVLGNNGSDHWSTRERYFSFFFSSFFDHTQLIIHPQNSMNSSSDRTRIVVLSNLAVDSRTIQATKETLQPRRFLWNVFVVCTKGTGCFNIALDFFSCLAWTLADDCRQ